MNRGFAGRLLAASIALLSFSSCRTAEDTAPKEGVGGHDDNARSGVAEQSVHTCPPDGTVQGWLVRHQSPAGYWDCHEFDQICCKACPTSCRDDDSAELQVAATALALDAFFTSGYDRYRPSPYRKTVIAAVEYLARSQNDAGRWSLGTGTAERLADAWATMALCHDFSSSKAKKFEAAARRGIAALRSFTSLESRDDVAVAAWCVLACAKGYEADFDAAREQIVERTKALFDEVISRPDSWREIDAAARGPQSSLGSVDLATAAWIIGRRALGDEDAVLEMAANWSKTLMTRFPLTLRTDRLPLPADELLLATIAMTHFEGEAREVWKLGVRGLLQAHVETNGCARGSWNRWDEQRVEIGRVGRTACLLTTLDHSWRNHLLRFR